jgi:preprotein translocase subunit SecA
MARQQCLAEEVAERLAKGEERFVEDEQFVYFYHLDAFYRVPKEAYQRIFEHFKRQCDTEHDEVVALGGLHIVATERMRRGASTNSCEDVRDGKAIPARRASTCRSKTT